VLEGEFGDPDGSPFIICEVWLPRFDLRRSFRLCIDTGATYTTLMPTEAFALGVGYTLLDDPFEVTTVGGTSAMFVELAEFIFTDADARALYVYRVMLAIAPPSIEITHLPSLLGRDIINRWRIDYHPTASELRCEVITADEMIELPSP
jgi:hypothetical protein